MEPKVSQKDASLKKTRLMSFKIQKDACMASPECNSKLAPKNCAKESVISSKGNISDVKRRRSKTRGILGALCNRFKMQINSRRENSEMQRFCRSSSMRLIKMSVSSRLLMLVDPDSLKRSCFSLLIAKFRKRMSESMNTDSFKDPSSQSSVFPSFSYFFFNILPSNS